MYKEASHKKISSSGRIFSSFNLSAGASSKEYIQQSAFPLCFRSRSKELLFRKIYWNEETLEAVSLYRYRTSIFFPFTEQFVARIISIFQHICTILVPR